LLNGLRGGIRILSLDRERGIGEVGEEVDRQVLHREQAEGGHRERGHEHCDRTVDCEAGKHRSGLRGAD